MLLKRLYQSPEDYRTHVRYIFGALILEVSYGIQPMSETDPFIILSETTIQRAAEAGVPGTYLVDIFPFRTKFKTELSQLGEQVIEMLNKPVEVAKNNIRNGNGRPSVVSGLIETFENDPNRPEDYEDIIKHVPGSAYIAAIDTINGVLLHFFHMMLLHPEVQKRAQEEIDAVVGPGALPSFEDFGKLKYLKALFQELLRCNAVAPIALPHVLTVDDVVNGYFIPKGTIVFGNSWTLLRSKSFYGPDADKFNPERFLDERTPYPDFAFGYGRRYGPMVDVPFGFSLGHMSDDNICLGAPITRKWTPVVLADVNTYHMRGPAGVALYFVSRWWNSRIPRGLKRPPGPLGHFLIGNLLDIPRSKEWLTFNRWANQYGDLCYLSIPGASLLFVNSYELAKELFETRGSIYSDRYRSIVLNDLLKFDWTIIHTAVENYHDVHIKYTKVLLKRLYQAPEDYRTHIRYILGASILEVTYGIQAASEKDPFLILSETTIQQVIEAGLPGTYLVDIFPVLKYIPSWFPGAKFKIELDQLGKQVLEMLNRPIEIARNSLKKGDAIPSTASVLIEQFENDPSRPDDYEDIIKHVTGVAYLAAVDTTNGLLVQFFYTILLHPEVQKRAQKELDEVVGPDALPSFNDLGRLKYMKAVFEELLRWNAVAPSGIPHVLNVDDVVNGYFIPKGTIVFGNTWTLLRSKSVYGSDADKFNPDRFLDGRMPYPDFAFGYGRRVCPGQYFGENTVFIAIVSILHLFDILPFEGENGPELPAENDFESGIILIVPRSANAVRTLEELDF
ncbi:hypothetical protein Clacol_005264 [Clathrus columnatus]|uniref:Cytochrome P450 n=1 Tax=Clathrus columnatus TaxID=1419009 RepID=A0AAV5AD24_9AGAM|nr:hypothetical protein Clacol_005264 [Clathrus columnatus]